MGRDAVAGIELARGRIEIRLVRDVADGARLGAAAEERALRSLEDLDALHVDHVDIEVARRELHRLLVEVDRHVGKRRRGRLGLVARADTAEAAHENVAGARPVAAEGDVGRVLEKVVLVLNAELLQLHARDRLHGERDVLHRLRSAGRSHGDLLKLQ